MDLIMRNLFLFCLVGFAVCAYSQQFDSIQYLQSVEVIGIQPVESVSQIKVQTDSVYYSGNDPFVTIRNVSPSVQVQSDNGTNYGYSYIRIRGIDQTRINFTLNGIPLNEMEDQGIYFSNMPDFLASMQSVQIDNGASIKFGTASIGGSVDLSPQTSLTRNLNISVGVGSFNTVRGCVKAASGLQSNGIAASTSISYLGTNGFRNNSNSAGLTMFNQIGYYGKSNLIKVFHFSGIVNNQMSWMPLSDSLLKVDYRMNGNTVEESDKFNQHFVTANWVNYSYSKLTFNSSVYFNNINGKYTSWLDTSTLGLFGLQSHHVGIISNVVYNLNPFNRFYFGLNVNDYQRNHTLADNAMPLELWYTNTGYKNDYSANFRWSSVWHKLNFNAGVQFRNAQFNYDKQLRLNWNFVNWKIVSKYVVSDSLTVYASYCKVGREPIRTDLLNGYDAIELLGSTIATAFGDTFAINSVPEHVHDIELGFTVRKKYYEFNLNSFYMQFHNERIGYGEINYIGLPLRTTVDNSKRFGLECVFTYRKQHLILNVQATLLRTSIRTYTDGMGIVRTNVSAFASPLFSGRCEVGYNSKYFKWTIDGLFVDKMYLDNTENELLQVNAYGLLGSTVTLTKGIYSIDVRINNILNSRYYLPGGASNYTGLYYPGALRNLFVGVHINLK